MVALQPLGKLSRGACESWFLKQVTSLQHKEKDKCKDLHGGFCLLDLEAEQMALQFSHI